MPGVEKTYFFQLVHEMGLFSCLKAVQKIAHVERDLGKDEKME